MKYLLRLTFLSTLACAPSQILAAVGDTLWLPSGRIAAIHGEGPAVIWRESTNEWPFTLGLGDAILFRLGGDGPNRFYTMPAAT
ncbi:MAG: hypothetical protein SGI92_33785 [Bryobacteraceae bacterium]|nr:hypothetical protein [Bryobacteraceae bacterium]